MHLESRFAGLSVVALILAAVSAYGPAWADDGGSASSSQSSPKDKTPVEATAGDASSAPPAKDAQGKPTKAPDPSTVPHASGYRPGTQQQNETAPIVKHSGHVDF